MLLIAGLVNGIGQVDQYRLALMILEGVPGNLVNLVAQYHPRAGQAEIGERDIGNNIASIFWRLPAEIDRRD